MTDSQGRIHDGFTILVLPCTTCGDVEVDTRLAAYFEQLDGGLRYSGVPCPTCAHTFTVEVQERSENPLPAPVLEFGDARNLRDESINALKDGRLPPITFKNESQL